MHMESVIAHIRGGARWVVGSTGLVNPYKILLILFLLLEDEARYFFPLYQKKKGPQQIGWLDLALIHTKIFNNEVAGRLCHCDLIRAAQSNEAKNQTS